MEVQREADRHPDIRAFAVMPAAPELSGAVATHLGLTMTILCDPTWQTHRSFGFGRASWSRLVAPRVVARGLRLLLAGRRLRRPAQDPRMLGGDVVVGPDGRVHYFRASRDPADYADAGALFRAARQST